MIIYTTFNHPVCKEVLSKIDAAADIEIINVKPRKNLINKNAQYIISNKKIKILEDVPALVVDDTVVAFGQEIIDFLSLNPETSKFLIDENEEIEENLCGEYVKETFL